ncbi:MAG: GerMN domain-containing protein [Lachnospiraceae bacterium]|nr:GerMN domain-containing protein [Lachnospiraceae bacterium]
MKRLGYFFILLLCTLLFTSCGEDGEQGKNNYQIYYIDSDGAGLVSEEYQAKASRQDTVNIIRELFDQMKTGGKDGIYQIPVSPEVEISNFQIKENQLSVYFSAGYNAKTGIEEILSRAAIVKTLCQVEGIEHVEFYIEDQPLMIAGNAVGMMNADSFTTSLSETREAQSRQVALYFADASGKQLIEVSSDVTYDATEPLAKLLLEELIAGPDTMNLDTSVIHPSIPSGTKINSITIRDNICYVDLSNEFNEMLAEVSSDVTIYSIVNTLCELSNVNRVQFTIAGELQEQYGETKEFHTAFERNLNLIKGGN